MKKVSKLIVLLVVLEYIKLIKIILILYPIQTIFIMMNVNMFFLIKTFQTNILIKIGKSFHLVSILNITTTDCQKRFYTY